MLSVMRQNATSWLIKVLLGMIVLVFVFLGMGSFDSERDNTVAHVNGSSITIDEYKQEYNRIVEQLRSRFGDRFNDEMLGMFKVKRQAMDVLIDRKVILDEAGKLDIEVSDRELATAIAGIGAFQKNGVFNSDVYRNVLSRNRLSPEMFELLQRDGMIQEKLSKVVMGSAKVSDEEVAAWFNWQNSSVSVEYALFASDMYKDIKPSEDQIKAFYEKNKQNYMSQPELMVQYLRFAPEKYSSAVEVAEAEITQYFEENMEMFRKAATVEARHILLKVDADADKVASDKVLVKAREIEKKARAGEDFADLAKEFSEGPSSQKGGFLGTFKKKDMVKPFADKAFSMKAGEISEPVKTQFGWHVIKVEKVNEATEPTLAAARAEIEKKLTLEKVRALAWDEAEAVYDVISDGEGMAVAVKGRNVVLETTPLFTKTGAVKGVNNSSKFVEFCFSLPDMETSEVEEIDGEYYIVKVTQKVPAKVQPLAEVLTTATEDLVLKMKDEKAAAAANAVIGELKDGKKTLEDVCKPHGVAVEITESFKRSGEISGIGYAPRVSEAAFKLSDINKIPAEAVKDAKGYYVISFKEKSVPDAKELDKEKDKIKETLLTRKKTETFRNWLAQEKETYEITIKKGFLD